ncbi:MAG: glycosyltransferase family 1 protein [Ginsengibacter sp.]
MKESLNPPHQMRIAVNAGSFKSHQGDNNKNLFTNTLLPLVFSEPKCTFIFLFDAPPSEAIHFPENAISAVIGPEADSPLKNKIWYQLKIPMALKKYKADIFITINYCSLKTKVPQLLISPDLAFINQPSLVNKKHLSFYKKNTPLFLDKASAIVVNSMLSKNKLIDSYKINEEKIKLFSKGVGSDFVPLEYEEKESIKERYAEGNEYFIYKGFIGQQQNLMNLIKAFSAFKKRQKSKMQLIIAGTPGIGYDDFLASLKGYRFKNELKILTDLTKAEMPKIIASAYAMVYVPHFETSSDVPLEAMKCDVPLIASSMGALPEFCGDAALYSDPADFKNIAENMMLIFKDEKRRKELIEKGRAQTIKFSGEQNFDSLFEIIKNIAGAVN